VAAGETNVTIDAGFYQVASLGDYVWNDLNANGVRMLARAVSRMYRTPLRHTNTLIDTKTTDANGLYAFDNLVPGEYQVGLSRWRVTYQPQYQAGKLPRQQSKHKHWLDGTVTLVSGENDLTIDARMYIPNQCSVDKDGYLNHKSLTILASLSPYLDCQHMAT